MTDFIINVSKIEEYQTLNNTHELEKVFDRAKSAIVNGAKVILSRKESSGKTNTFDEMDTLEALKKYREQVFKYLTPYYSPLQQVGEGSRNRTIAAYSSLL